MKKFLAVLLAAVLVFGLSACIDITVPGDTKSEDQVTTKAPEKDESVTAAPETDEPETDEPETERETKPVETNLTVEPGLFKGTYTDKTYNNTGISSLYLQKDAGFCRETTWSDGGGENNIFGNYVSKDGKVYAYAWFSQAGDPALYPVPDEVAVYEIVDEDTLTLISDTETATYKRVTDQAEINEFADLHNLIRKLAIWDFVSGYGTPSQPTENPAKAVSVYEYHVTEGFLRDVELVFFENGRFYLKSFYDDGSAGSIVIGNYYYEDNSFYLVRWFTGGGDPSLTFVNFTKERFIDTKNAKLLTSAFQGSTGGLDIALDWNGSVNLETYTKEYEINVMLKYMLLLKK